MNAVAFDGRRPPASPRKLLLRVEGVVNVLKGLGDAGWDLSHGGHPLAQPQESLATSIGRGREHYTKLAGELWAEQARSGCPAVADRATATFAAFPILHGLW